MVITASRTLSPHGTPDPEDAAFSQLFGSLDANPSVQCIAVQRIEGSVDLWARLGDDDEANEMALYDALAAYHASPGVTTLVDLHLVLAHERDDAFPASLVVLYRRHL